MSRQTNKEVENYWAARLLETGFLAELVRATQLERIDPEQHGDPPDAMYGGLDARGARLQLWVEISGAWRSAEGAKETFEVAERRKPAPTGPHGLLAGPDQTTAKSVAHAVCSKLKKKSYLALVREFGPGHLHVFVASDHYPLFDIGTLAEIRRYVAMLFLDGQIRISISFGRVARANVSSVELVGHANTGEASGSQRLSAPRRLVEGGQSLHRHSRQIPRSTPARGRYRCCPRDLANGDAAHGIDVDRLACKLPNGRRV